jgi:hypothetical protein
MYVFDHIGAALPSGESAEALVRGEPGALPKVIFHTALRAGLVGVGLVVAGMSKPSELVRYSLAGALGIEAFVLVWAYANKGKT